MKQGVNLMQKQAKLRAAHVNKENYLKYVFFFFKEKLCSIQY